MLQHQEKLQHFGVKLEPAHPRTQDACALCKVSRPLVSIIDTSASKSPSLLSMYGMHAGFLLALDISLHEAIQVKARKSHT